MRSSPPAHKNFPDWPRAIFGPAVASAIAACGLLGGATARAEVKLPAIFSDHMVLERAARVPVWGWADPGEQIQISLGKARASAVGGKDGRWKASLDLQSADADSQQMIVEGRNKLVIEDVLVGEVWVASGQSNMEWRLSETSGAAEEIARSTNASLRFFQAEKISAPAPAEQMRGRWVKSEPAGVAGTTAVGYYFGKKLQAELGVPVGIINCTWGGTPVEAWTSPDALKSVADLKASSERIWADIANFPARQKQFASAFPDWLKEAGRENPVCGEPGRYASPEVSTADWKPVTLPGDLSAQGLPATGVIWLRKDVNYPAKPGGEIRLIVGEADRFDALYLNGQFVKEYTCANYAKDGPRRVYLIPNSLIQPGRNVVALRVFAPASPAKFNREPYGMPFERASEWMAKVETEFPALAGGHPAPKMPVTPPYPQHVAGAIFNGMINPLIPYAISGVIWYQGEANAGRAVQYRTTFPLLVQDWRSHWNQGEFPFYFCQLPNFGPKKGAPSESAWAELREAQNKTLALSHTGQAVLIDQGEAGDVHPRNKKEAGERLARIALAKDYGKNVSYSGPAYKSMKVEGGKVRLLFDCAGEKLVAAPVPETYVETAGKSRPLERNSPGSQLEGFAICGDDRVWHWADAKVAGDGVVEVWSDKVLRPAAVRYAWSDNPNINLFSAAGLPVSPFRTDNFTLSTENAKF